MYELKSTPEDFYVKENLDFKQKIDVNGDYSLFTMKKIDIDSTSAFYKLAKFLNISTKAIGYCGIKDRKAITEQYITLPASSKERALSLDSEIKGLSLIYIDNLSEKLNIGDLNSNFFRIVVRNLEENDIDKIKNVISENKRFPNFYGEQRFSENNVSIGRNLIKKNFSGALDILKKDPSYKEHIEKHLNDNPNDFVGALSKVPKQMLIFYVHAYQSYLWNLCVQKIISEKIDLEEEFPLIGFYFRSSGVIEKISDDVMKAEAITPRDFIVRELPFLSAEGGSRNIYMEPENLHFYFGEDELNLKKKKMTLEFSLSKGNYATTFIEQLFKKV